MHIIIFNKRFSIALSAKARASVTPSSGYVGSVETEDLKIHPVFRLFSMSEAHKKPKKVWAKKAFPWQSENVYV